MTWWKQVKMAGPVTASTGTGSATTPGLETKPLYGRKKDEEVTEEEFYSTKKEDKNFVLRVGDFIRDNKMRDGTIDSISIGMEPNDIAGEYKTAVDVEEYHTELGYQGAVSFGKYWCYFNQIISVGEEDADN